MQVCYTKRKIQIMKTFSAASRDSRLHFPWIKTTSQCIMTWASCREKLCCLRQKHTRNFNLQDLFRELHIFIDVHIFYIYILGVYFIYLKIMPLSRYVTFIPSRSLFAFYFPLSVEILFLFSFFVLLSSLLHPSFTLAPFSLYLWLIFPPHGFGQYPGGGGYYIRSRVGESSGLWTLQQWMGYTLDKSTWLVTWTGKRGQDSQDMIMFGKRIFLRKCLWKRINFLFNIFTKMFRIRILSQIFFDFRVDYFRETKFQTKI